MQRWRRRVVHITAAVAGVLTASFAVPAADAVTGQWTVTQNLLPGLTNATDLGAAASNKPMTLMATVARPNPAGEQALLDAEHDPSSRQFGQFLSPDEFAARFGVPQSQLDQVTAWL